MLPELWATKQEYKSTEIWAKIVDRKIKKARKNADIKAIQKTFLT